MSVSIKVFSTANYFTSNLVIMNNFFLLSDADGTLCVDEFQSILKNRQSRSLSKDRDVGMVDFFSCVSQCWQNRNSKEQPSN